MKGDTAHNDPSPSPDYPVSIGGSAETTAPAAVSDADRVKAWFDEFGRLVVVLKDTSGNNAITFSSVAGSGELAGATAQTQMPSVACKAVLLRAVLSNAGNVYIGGSGVTKVDGTTDTTTGYELGPGEQLPLIPISNLNLLYRICDNNGDDLTYLALS